MTKTGKKYTIIALVALIFGCPVAHAFGAKGWPWCESVSTNITY